MLLKLLIGLFAILSPKLSNAYDETISNKMVYYDMISYCKPNIIQHWSCGEICNSLNVTDITIIDNSKFNAQAYLAYDNNLESVIISFRGTEPLSIKNWLIDIDFVKEPYIMCNECEVHTGFYNIYKSISKDLITVYKNYNTQYGNKLYVTGHSLGGSITQHFIAELKYNNFDLNYITVYTYGMPRTGNKNFANYLTDIVQYRVTHNADPVPHIFLIELGFWHPSQEIWYKEDNKSFKKCDLYNGEDSTCSNSLLIDLDIIDHITYLGQDFTKHVLQCG